MTGTAIDIKNHEQQCEYLQKHCETCNELLTKHTQSTHFCIKSLSDKLQRMELILKKITKCDLDHVDLTSNKSLSGGIFRYVNPSEY